MIKGRVMMQSKTPGVESQVLLLGLDGENMARLMADEPILIKSEEIREMGFTRIDAIAIIGGKDIPDLESKARRMVQVMP